MDRFATWADLSHQWDPNPAEKPRTLPLEAITRCPRLVHFRDPNAYQAIKHADDLKHRIKRTGAALDPLLVGRAGDQWILLDGYLRWAAYKAAKWARKVPVVVFAGSAADALLAAIEANSRLQLALTPEERSNAAWRLVRLGAHSKAAIAQTTGTGATSVARMRQQLKRLRDAGENPDSYPLWHDARRAFSDREEYEDFDEDAERKDLMERLMRAWGPRLQQQPELCADTLYHAAGHRARDLAYHLADLTGLVDVGDLDEAYQAAFEFRPRHFHRDDEADF